MRREVVIKAIGRKGRRKELERRLSKMVRHLKGISEITRDMATGH